MHSVETLSAFCLSAAQPMLSLVSSGSRVYLIVVLVMLKQTFNVPTNDTENLNSSQRFNSRQLQIILKDRALIVVGWRMILSFDNLKC